MSTLSRNISSAQVKSEIIEIVTNLGLQKSQVKLSCAKRVIKVHVIDIIATDKFEELSAAIKSHFHYYNRNAGDLSADYADYRTNLVQYSHVDVCWDFDSTLIKKFISEVKSKLISIIGDNSVIPYSPNAHAGYPLSAHDIARMSVVKESLRKIISGARIDYHGGREIFIS